MCVNSESYENIHYLTSLDLIFFEYFLTFDQEVRLFWGKKLTGAVALFFANRYLPFIDMIIRMDGALRLASAFTHLLMIQFPFKLNFPTETRLV